MTNSRPNRPRPRRGVIAVLAAILMVVVFAMLAFAVDIGYIANVDTELQRTADACALAAVQHLPEKSDVVAAAQFIAVQNKGFQGPELGVSDIKFGLWDRDTATFLPSTTNSPNAVKVTVERSDSKNSALRLFFAPIIGTSSVEVKATAIATYDENFCGPLIGIEWVEIPGDPSVDSYRSADGNYASQAPRDNGNVCSDGPIGLDGNPVVNGDANPGRDHETTLAGGSVVTGNMSPRLRPLNLPEMDISDYEFDNDNDSLPGIQKGNSLVSPVDADGNFLLDGGRTYDMPPGTYYLNDLTMTGQSTLNLNGPTTIYLTGNLDTAGGFLINNTKVASNLKIFMQGGDGSTANVTSSVDLYAVVYAPNTAVETRGAAGFFGSVVGRTLVATGTGDIHYDESLDLDGKLNLPRRVQLVE